jgi:hypothetical protein
MIGLLSADDRGIGDQREVDARIGDQVGLELGEIHIQGTIKAERGSDRGDNLANEPVEVGVGWAVNVKIPAADVIDGLIVNHESTVRVLKGGVGGQDAVVGLNNSGGDLGSRVDREFELGLLAIVH